jgi:hypothetical protein
MANDIIDELGNNAPEDILPVDELIRQSDKRAADRVQQMHEQAVAQIKRRTDDEFRAIYDQFELRRTTLEQRHRATLDPKARAAIERQMADFRMKFEGQVLALKNKYRPANREIDTAMKQAKQKVAFENRERDRDIQLIRSLVGRGVIVDPTAATKAEYEVLGINIPAAQLRARGTLSRSAIKSQLQADIRGIDAALVRYAPQRERVLSDPAWRWWGMKKATIVDPDTGTIRKLDPKNEKDKAIIAHMDGLKVRKDELLKQYQDMLIEDDPRYKPAIEGSRALREANRIMNGEGRQGGGFKESLTIAKSKTKAGKAALKVPTSPQVYKLGQTISRGGKTYRVTGYDTDGTPMVEEVR